MTSAQDYEVIPVAALLDKVRAAKARGCRLVQLSATRLPDQVEVTYSFDANGQLINYRVYLPGAAPVVPSISAIYGCVLLYENELHDLFNVEVQGMAVDFHGQLYRTAVKFPFGSVKAPLKTPAAAPAKASVPSPTPVAQSVYENTPNASSSRT